MTHPIVIAPVTRAIARIVEDCLRDGWGLDDVDDIALQVANALSPQPDPVDPDPEVPSDVGLAGTGKGPAPRQREFGDRIRTRRLKLGLSQEAVALGSGINRTYIGSLEAGERNPSLENIARLALALGVDTADLVRGLQKLKGRD